MPSFGFNPFAKRINVYTTGIEMGDAKRYYSRDVIRIGGEKVRIDPLLTPGEPGRKSTTRFEEEVQQMVQNSGDVDSGKRLKLQFVKGSSSQELEENQLKDGLITYDEFSANLSEKKRRRELARYSLSAVGSVLIGNFMFRMKLRKYLTLNERDRIQCLLLVWKISLRICCISTPKSSFVDNVMNILSNLPSSRKVFVLFPNDWVEKRPLAEIMDREIDDFISLFVFHISNNSLHIDNE